MPEGETPYFAIDKAWNRTFQGKENIPIGGKYGVGVVYKFFKHFSTQLLGRDFELLELRVSQFIQLVENAYASACICLQAVELTRHLCNIVPWLQAELNVKVQSSHRSPATPPDHARISQQTTHPPIPHLARMMMEDSHMPEARELKIFRRSRSRTAGVQRRTSSPLMTTQGAGRTGKRRLTEKKRSSR